MHNLDLSPVDLTQFGGVVYAKEKMLEIHRLDNVRMAKFTDSFQHLPRVTTPEFLTPLAAVPISAEEMELRAAPIAAMLQAGERCGVRGFQDLRGQGRGRGQVRVNDSGREQRGSEEGSRPWASGDVQLDGRPSRGSLHAADALSDSLPGLSMLPAARQAQTPFSTAPNGWFYRDLNQTVQGPFSASQISDWFFLGLLPENLQIRSHEDPPDCYIPLVELIAKHGGEPPFVKAYRYHEDQIEAMVAVKTVEFEHQTLREKPLEERPMEQQGRAEKHTSEEATQPQKLQCKEEEAMFACVGAPARAEQYVFEEGVRLKKFEEARCEAVQDAERLALELRQCAVKNTPGQTTEHARLLDEETQKARDERMQQLLLPGTEQLAMQLGHASEAARWQRGELPRRHVALEGMQLRQTESEVRSRRQALAQQQAVPEEDQREPSIMPPVSAHSSNMLSFHGLEVLPRQLQQQERQESIAASRFERFLSHSTPLQNVLPSACLRDACLPELQVSAIAGGCTEAPGLGRRGRGRGRGACLAAMGANRRSNCDLDTLLNSGRSLPPSHALVHGQGDLQLLPCAQPLSSASCPLDLKIIQQQAQDPAPPIGVVDANTECDALRQVKKGKRVIKGKCKEVDCVANAVAPIWREKAPAAPVAANASVWGWGAQHSSIPAQAKSMQEIQEEEELEQKVREAKTKAAVTAPQSQSHLQPSLSSAWANSMPGLTLASSFAVSTLGATSSTQSAKGAPRHVEVSHPSASVMLWDYSAEDMLEQPADGVAAPSLGLISASWRCSSSTASPSNVSNKESHGIDASPRVQARQLPKAPPNSIPLYTSAPGSRLMLTRTLTVFATQGCRRNGSKSLTDLVVRSMPPALAHWCQEQMNLLTGNEDTKLTHFLFSLQNDNEVESYLKMYLGDSPAVMTFAKELTHRKQAARGTSKSRECQVAGKSCKLARAPSLNDAHTTAKRKASKKKGTAVDPSLLGYSVESSRIMQGEIQFIDGL